MQHTKVPNNAQSFREIARNHVPHTLPLHSGHRQFEEQGPKHDSVFLVRHMDAQGKLDKIYQEVHDKGVIRSFQIEAPTYRDPRLYHGAQAQHQVNRPQQYPQGPVNRPQQHPQGQVNPAHQHPQLSSAEHDAASKL